MSDPVPVNTNRLAFALGQIFHPYVITAVTLYVVLEELSLGDALKWMALLLAILIIPNLILINWARRGEHYVYQRGTRTLLYAGGWISVLVCIALIVIWDGPERLLISFVILAVWLPVQMAVNRFYTKISTHAGVTAGSGASLWLFGVLDSPALKLAVLAIVILTAWARWKTRNHTLKQILLGWFVAVASVVVVFGVVG